MTENRGTAPFSNVDDRRIIRGFYRTIPLYILVPIGFALTFEAMHQSMQWIPFAAGALGWFVALMLRGPIALAIKKAPKNRAVMMMGSVSGPFEELVRLFVLLFLGVGFSSALSIGQGWAAIEVLFTIINGMVIVTVIGRNDEKSIQVKELLESTGNLNQSPLLGIWERIFASAFHIGSTLLLARHLWMVVLLAPIHSILNLAAVNIAKKYAIMAEVFIAIIGTIVLFAGITLFGF
ncbi:YhfC family intramembrane metalloprotease [Ferroacidibacillus organovorans]|uniref:YhfC family intramembrane metalloprotease n=1 Tax=Ferroacidibacillus organovorans TaxID=1765683 RepID=A0A117SX54_9BACL|nr:YhfC family intramembrane metalloprotease [Ferroacidibacillus organovorans]KUO94880.1 hypothetical protein ATW55_10275 [Ferroacidibacillus organovorans]